MRSTHSLATLPISKGAYEEIAKKLIAAGYGHVFIKIGGHRQVGDRSYKFEITPEDFEQGKVMIDLNGIALVLDREEQKGDGTGNCFKCGRAMQSANRAGQFICFDCGKTPTEDEIHPKEELSKRDKNYYLGKENK
jgi:hypothetical protein